MKFPERGLYVITQAEGLSIQQLVLNVEAALKGGAAVVQYRDKNPTDARLAASELLRICHAYRVPLLINDSVELALDVGADGVHLGKDDGEIDLARRRLGKHAIIGVSCYNDVQKASFAVKSGADYVAFGRFFPSGTKPLARPAEFTTLNLAKQLLPCPLVAIGGILPSNGGQLIDAGADLLAVIGGVFDHEPEAAVRAYLSLF